MTDTPKTPAPPRRKAGSTARKSTRVATSKVAGEGKAVKPATAAKAPAKRTVTAKKPAARRTPAAKKTPSRVEAAKQAVSHSAPVQLVSETREAMGDRNFFAAILGGVAAIGAAVAGVVYALREGNPDNPDKTPGKK